MADTTANGYPYAVPSDPLVQWPATSQSLAEKIDTQLETARVAAGQSQVTTDATGFAVVPEASQFPGFVLRCLHLVTVDGYFANLTDAAQWRFRVTDADGSFAANLAVPVTWISCRP
jgi:hypothetical protein